MSEIIIDLFDSDSDGATTTRKPRASGEASRNSDQEKRVSKQKSTAQRLRSRIVATARTKMTHLGVASKKTGVQPPPPPSSSETDLFLYPSTNDTVEIDSSDDEADLKIHIQKLHNEGKGSAQLENLIKREPTIEMVDDDRKQPAAVTSSQNQPLATRKALSRIELDDERKKLEDSDLAVRSKEQTATKSQQKVAARVATKKNTQLKGWSKKPKSVPHAAAKPSSHHLFATKEATKHQARNEQIILDDSSDDDDPIRASAKRSLSDEDAVSIDDSDYESDDGDVPVERGPSLGGQTFSSSDDDCLTNERRKEGTNAEYAICLSSEDDDSDDGRECMRPGKATIASRFSQLTGLSSPRRNSQIKLSPIQRSRGGQMGPSGHAQRGPSGSRKVEPKSVARQCSGISKLQKGQRKVGSDEGDEALVPLGRKSHGSRLGLSIKEKSVSKYASRQPEASDSDDSNSRISKSSSFSPKRSSISRRSPSQIKEALSKKISSGSDYDESSTGSGGTGKLLKDSDSGISQGCADGSDADPMSGSDEEFEYLETAAAKLPSTPEHDMARQKDDSASGMDQPMGATDVKISRELRRDGSMAGIQSIPPTHPYVLWQAIANRGVAHLSETQPHVGTSVEAVCPKKTARKSCGEDLRHHVEEGKRNESIYSQGIAETLAQLATHSHDEVAIAAKRAQETVQNSTGQVQQRRSAASVEEESDSSFGSCGEASKENFTNTRTDINKFTENKPIKASTRKRRGRPKTAKAPDSLEKTLATFDPQVQRESRRKRQEEPPTPLSEADKFVMLEVPHLGSTTYPNGLPCRRFSVYANSDDSILYDFEINIKQSKVSKHAGLGAFLVYRGARTLKKDRKRLILKKIRGRHIFNPETLERLTARRQDGSSISVKLTGNHLHGHNNSILRTATEVPLRAVVDRKKVTVRLSGKNLHRDIDEDETFGLPCCPKTFGKLCLNIESDYVLDSSIEFSEELANTFSIELARYGPVRKYDRKRKVDFDTKSFLLDHEPSGWDFGVEESFLGQDQMIDITDDGTGEPHDEAKRQTALYVNEVGHNLNLVQNVISSTIGGNVVQYFIELKRGMKKGKEVELLTDYHSHYELNRERKGYGKANLSGETKSDCDMATRLKRNFAEREGIEAMVEGLDALELFYALDFVTSQVLPPISKSTDDIFLAEPVAKISTPRQLIARIRMHWMAPLYLQRVKQLDDLGFKGSDEESQTLSKGVVKEMMDKCKEWAHDVQWNALRNQALPPAITNLTLKGVFDMEITEEVLHYAKDQLEDPLDLNAWCPIARDMTISLCIATFEQLRFGQKLCRETLATAFLQCAVRGKEAIFAAKESNSYSRLTFSSGTEGSLWVKATQKNLVVLAAGTALSNSGVLKGATSSLIDVQAYSDLCDLGFLEPQVELGRREMNCDGPILIVCDPAGKSAIDGVPRRVDYVSKHHGQINERWYLAWQNLYLVHVLFHSLVRKFSDSPADHHWDDTFLSRLCDAANVDKLQGRAIVAMGVRKDLAAPQTIFRSTLELESRKRKGRKYKAGLVLQRTKRAPKAKLKKRKAAKPAKKRSTGGKFSNQMFFKIVWSTLTELGWTLLVGNRPTDFYFLPKGVQRGRQFGFKPRVDFFDSYKLVIDFVKKDERWKENEKIQECLALFERCQAFMREKKVKGQLKLEWVIEQVIK